MDTPLIRRPIFIVGVGRSGTTLLRSMLSAHSRISVPPETHFLKYAEREGLAHGAPPDFDAFWARYTSWVRFKDLEIDEAHVRELIRLQGEPTFHAIFRALLTAYAERTGKPRVGEKTPGHTWYLDRLLDWFPDAQVLVMQRDPRAVVASHLHTPWVRTRLTPRSVRYGLFTGKRLGAVLQYAGNWAEVYQRILPRWRDDPRFVLVRYESLVHDPEPEIRRVCEFFGERFELQMLAGRSREAVPVSGVEMKNEQLKRWRRTHEAQTLRPVTTTSVDKWRTELSSAELAVVESLCARGMDEAGYRTEGSTALHAAGRLLSTGFPVLAAAESRLRGALSAPQ